MSGPGAGGVQTASAVLGDVVSILAGEAPVHETREDLPIVADVTSSFYLHLEVADRPGVLAQIAQVLGDNEVSVKSVVQRGIGEDARLVMVVHECLESRFVAAVAALADLDFLRGSREAIAALTDAEAGQALDSGEAYARRLLAGARIKGALLMLAGKTRGLGAWEQTTEALANLQLEATAHA